MTVSLLAFSFGAKIGMLRNIQGRKGDCDLHVDRCSAGDVNLAAHFETCERLKEARL